MIDSMGLRNFKCFGDIELSMRRLTVLTGINGAGKSTVIQALLLARQAAEDDRATVVQLNGPYGLELGEASDVLYSSAEEQFIEITVRISDEAFSYKFNVALDDRLLHLPITARPDQSPTIIASQGMPFSYLTAERLGPRDQLAVASADRASLGVGVRGEYVAQTLALRERDLVADGLRHPDAPTVQTFRAQTEAWLSEIVRPLQITTQWPVGLNASLIRFQVPGMVAEPLRPSNVGFGVSYALPIIVAGLAVGDGILIVENPEAHLHPAGQSKLGRFLGRVAGSGAQVVVETHSDHVLNGIRLAAVDERTVSPSDFIVHYFGGGESTPTPIDMGSLGGLSAWPTAL